MKRRFSFLNDLRKICGISAICGKSFCGDLQANLRDLRETLNTIYIKKFHTNPNRTPKSRYGYKGAEKLSLPINREFTCSSLKKILACLIFPLKKKSTVGKPSISSCSCT